MRGTTIGIGLAALLLPVACLAAGPEHGGVSDYQFWEFVWRVMNFVVMAAVLVVLLKKPVSLGLKERSQAIAAELRDRKQPAADEARRQYAELEEALGDAQAQREAILAIAAPRASGSARKSWPRPAPWPSGYRPRPSSPSNARPRKPPPSCAARWPSFRPPWPPTSCASKSPPATRHRLLDEYLAGLAATPH